MRFGLTPVHDFPAVMRTIFDEGSIDISRFSYPKLIERTVSSGFNHVELTLDLIHAMPGSLSRDRIGEIRERKDSLGFTLSAHLPIWAVEPSSFNEGIRSASVLTCVDAIGLAEELEPEFYVYHSTGALAGEFSRLPYPDEYKRLINSVMASGAMASITEMLEKSGVEARRVAIESVEFPLELTVSMAEGTGCSLLLDTGHVLAGYGGEESLMDALSIFLPKMVGVHAHDGMRRRSSDGSSIVRDHLPLGSGDMPISDFFGALLNADFSGPVVFELSLEDALRSIEAIRRECPNA